MKIKNIKFNNAHFRIHYTSVELTILILITQNMLGLAIHFHNEWITLNLIHPNRKILRYIRETA